MNLGEIKTRVYRTFGDESAVQVTDADIVRWVNDGQRKICLENEGMLQSSTTTSIVANQQTYSLPADLLVLRSLQYKRTGDTSFYKLRYLSMQEFDEWIDGWNGTTYNSNDSTVYTVYAGEIILFPIPEQSGTNNLKIYYSAQPTDVANDNDNPSLPVIYHNALVDYCLSQAYMLDEDWNAAGNVSQKMQADINKLKSRETATTNNFEAYPRISLLWDDAW